MSIINLGNSVPKTLREWSIAFRGINQVIEQTPTGVNVRADNLPAQEATYVTLSNNQSLPNDRALTGKTGETTVVDGGPGSSVQIGLADKGTAGTYPKVVTDSKGRVVAGAALITADMPAQLQRIYTGTGSPNGVVTSSPGAIYLNLAGGANVTLYVKETGMGNAGWVAK